MILNTVKDAIEFAVKQFARHKIYCGHGIDNIWDEAVYLILHVLFLPHDSKAVILKRKLDVCEQKLILAIITRRVRKRVPTPYLTNEAYFAGLLFFIDKRVLIPRSPLGELIVNRFEPWIKPHQVKNILEIGTGSGCIAISCAKMFTRALVDATDIMPEALVVAKNNCRKHRVTKRINFIISDVFRRLPKKKYDIIISNPPYVGEEEMQDLPPEYVHEPQQALLAGKDGHEIVSRIINKAAEYLTEHGILIVEVGNSAPLIIKKYPQLPFIWLDFTQGESEVFLLTKEGLDCLRKRF